MAPVHHAGMIPCPWGQVWGRASTAPPGLPFDTGASRIADTITSYLEVPKGFSDADRDALEAKVNAALREGSPDEGGPST